MTPPQLLERLARIAEKAATQIEVKSALNPCLWLCAVVSIPSLILVVIAEGWAQVFFAAIAAGPVIIAISVIVLFALKDPSKLQSESYQLQSQRLELIREKGGELPLSPTTVEIVPNPELPTRTTPE